jgi:hypothetical protein
MSSKKLYYYNLKTGGSFEKERSAVFSMQMFDRMMNQMHQSDSFSEFPYSPTDLKQAFLYYLSKPTRDLWRKRKQQSDIPLKNAHSVLQWTMRQFDLASQSQEKHTIAACIESMLHCPVSGPNSGLCRLMVSFLEPMQGTYASSVADATTRELDATPKYLEALHAASQVNDIMQRIHNDNTYFPNIQPDKQSYQSILNLMGKRCKFLVFLGAPPPVTGRKLSRKRRGVDFNDPRIHSAMGGCKTPRDCIDMAKQLLASMEKPDFVHYSMLISMMSYSSRREMGLGDEANEIVQDLLHSDLLKNTKDGLCILCNPILTCYAEEALFAKEKRDKHACQEAQEKALGIWENLKKSPDPAVAANPITYSIIMKMFRDLDRAEKVQQILDCMESENMNPGDVRGRVPPPMPVSVHYNIAVSAWSKSTHGKAGERAIQLLNRMEQNRGTRFPLPNKIAYTSALDAVLRSSTAEDVVERIDKMLLRFENLNDPRQSPDAVTYNVIFRGLAHRVEKERNRPGKEKLAQQTENLFKTLRNRSNAFNVAGQRRMYQYYNSCIRAWAMSESEDYFANVLRLLNEMEVDKIASSRPDSTTYESIISSLLSKPDECAVNRASEIFVKMENSGVPRSRLSVESFLELALQCRFPGSTIKADENFVRVITDRFKVNSHGNRIPDSFEYRTVFRYLMNRQHDIVDTKVKEKIARRMELLLRVLIKDSEHFCLVEGANMCLFFNDCIKAWAHSNSPLSKDRSSNLLRDMEEISDPTKGKAIVHGAIIHAQPKSDTYEHIFRDLAHARDESTFNHARMLFQKMDGKNLPISLPILNYFLEILVKAGAVEEAERTIKEMEDRSTNEPGVVRPDHTSYAILLSGFQKSQGTYMLAHKLLYRMEEMSNTLGVSYVRSSMFTKMIHLWSESNVPSAVEHVEELFKKLKSPTSADFFSLQKAWVNSDRPESAQRVESILVQLQSDFDSGRTLSKPSIDNFAVVIHCWAKKGEINRAKAILNRMESLYKLGGEANVHLKPTSACYETLLSGLYQSGNADAVQLSTDILDFMETGHSSVLPSLACYHQVIQTIRKYRVRYKASRSFSILQRMKNSSQAGENIFVRPTHETFVAVLECCCGDSIRSAIRRPDGKENAFDFAVKTMQEYFVHIKSAPRRNAYLKFLQAARDLMRDSEKRDAAVLSIFCNAQRPCPRPYLVHPAIRSALKMTVTRATLQQIEKTKPST